MSANENEIEPEGPESGDPVSGDPKSGDANAEGAESDANNSADSEPSADGAEAPEGEDADGGSPDVEADVGAGAVAADSPWAGADPAARIEELEAEAAELKDKLLRALAEAENVRRRAQRDKEDASKFAIKNFAVGVLSVADNLGRALASIDADARAADANLENVCVGMDMVSRELVTTFERYGIIAIKALGAKFDPMLHEAMFEIEDTETAAGTIAQVLEPGYLLHGRTLRAAKVGITKGGPKDAPAPVESAESTEDSPATESGAPGDPATREGQAAYENQTDPKDLSGGQLDEEL